MSGTDWHARTEKWIEQNPEVYAIFRRFAEQMLMRRRRFGIGQLAERVRWELITMREGRDFKINNNYRAYIARRLVKDDPRLEPLIEMRMVNHGPIPFVPRGKP